MCVICVSHLRCRPEGSGEADVVKGAGRRRGALAASDGDGSDGSNGSDGNGGDGREKEVCKAAKRWFSLKVQQRSARRRQARGPKRLKRLGVVSERSQAPLQRGSCQPPPTVSLIKLLRNDSVHDPAAVPATTPPALHPHHPPLPGGFTTTRINGSYWIVFNACCAQLVATGFSYNVESQRPADPSSFPPPPPTPPTSEAYDAYDGDGEEATDIEDIPEPPDVDEFVHRLDAASDAASDATDPAPDDAPNDAPNDATDTTDCMSCMTVVVSPPSTPLPSLVPHMRRCGDSDSDSSLSHNAAAAVRSAGNVASVLTTQRGGPTAAATRFVDTGTAHLHNRMHLSISFRSFRSFIFDLQPHPFHVSDLI